MKKIAFIISLGFTFSGIAQTAGTLTFSFNEVSKPTSATYNNYGKHVLAVWIQSDLGQFVKTISRNVGSVTRDHLQTWAVNSGGTASNAIAANCNVVSATTCPLGSPVVSTGGGIFTLNNVLPFSTIIITGGVPNTSGVILDICGDTIPENVSPTPTTTPPS